MTDHVARLYALLLAVVVFFVVWATVAAHPWTPTRVDPAVAAVVARQHRVRIESVRVKRIVDARWAAYRRALVRRNVATRAVVAHAAPAVRVVNLPPLVITRTS